MSERLRELLLKAVRGLEPEERDEILSELLVGEAATAHLAASQIVAAMPAAPPRWRSMVGALRGEEVSATLAMSSGDVKVLPVRLPEAAYERLRAWSKENGFSMAVIIRTLVERFLDDQERRAGATPS